jgi:DHA1 family tetracycline resistance protein-like MFS transporter
VPLRMDGDVNFIARILFESLTLLRAMAPAARVATLLFFAAGVADGTLMPFFALWARSEGGMPVEFVGLLLACYAAGELIAMPVVGGIADCVGRRPVLLISTLGVGCGFLLLYWSHGVVAAALSLLVIGVFESVLHPTAATVLADVVPGPALRDHFAVTRVASDAGHVIGPAFGALLVQHSLGLVFAGSAVVLLTGATAVALFLPETRASGAASGEEDDDDATAIFAVFRDRRLAALLVPIALTGIAASWIETVLPLFAADGGILSAAGVGFLFSYAALLSVVFQLPLTRASADIPADRMIWVSGMALVAAFGSLLVSSQLPFLVVGVSLLALSQMLAGPLTQAMSSDLASTHSRATYMAAYSAVNDVRDAAGPAIGTTLYALAARLPWLVGVPITLLATLVLARSAKGERARQEACPVPEHANIGKE